MKNKLLKLSTAAVAVSFALAGCAGTSGTPAPGGMEHGSHSAKPTTGTGTGAAVEHNDADVMFAQMMIPHHAQAVEMSGMVLAKQDIPAPVTALATRIKAAQDPEIQTMTGWLKEWNEPVESGHAGHSMEGMMDQAAMAELENAQGTEAARLFLEQMIVHHEGALTMAEAETADGKDPRAIELSKEIVAAQEAEIKEMRDLLGTL
ncbi:DUF305 domain-containing protein [Pseudarthrobacter sp. J75]|uniref:DUF305 domain-containing protein n=1 Tax=unclassified Pseudarthrobacter TaxID=2647000 RepID=UPI002E822AD5|nr:MULTISPECIES: DUF305 domain-containing protein [unclassified Pseudarthrobacter]MEE2522165.1 DUF305 domain-containing protein [Pseudarthrobacter sp. J47]MEE2528189.1 DUF305 domain-containing protein [Pseudarthrobacter sp. J75]MEE2567891.1 DUF305 domain-containing protein [Pseudarthrobacter sp. J64]